jgi:class 3 adenylate cyclase/TolB-like protein/Tfp pilus assembly protein PilF
MPEKNSPPELAERRLLAILAADVVGYSRLVGLDEEGTVERVKRLKETIIEPAITSHHGRLVKTTGDGFLIMFASAVDAMRCAIGLQRTLPHHESAFPDDKRLRLRIGVHLGDVLLQDNDIFGDGVNVAARLEALAEPGGILVSQSVREQVERQIDAAFSDLGLRTLKNIERPVRVAKVLLDCAPNFAVKLFSRQRQIRTVAILTLSALLTAVWWWWPQIADRVSSQHALKTGPAVIAVKPFVNLSGDPGQDYFSEGFTEDVIAALGRFRELSVLARSAVTPLKGKTLSPREAGRLIGANYLVEGSVRRSAQRFRLSVQLSETASGTVLWSEQLDGDPKDAIAVQEETSRRIAGALAAKLGKLEQIKSARRPQITLEAYDLVLRARALRAQRTREGNVEARRLVEDAIKQDPSNAGAYVELGFGLRDAIALGWLEDVVTALKRAEDAARKAIALDPQSAQAYVLLGRVLVITHNYDGAQEALRRAIELNPSDSEALAGLGDVLTFSGKVEEAIRSLERALAINPQLTSDNFFFLAIAYYLADRYQDSLRIAEKAIGESPNLGYLHVIAAIAQAQLGRAGEAQATAAEARRRLPYFDPDSFGNLVRDPKLRDKLAAGLSKAGFN